MIDYETLAAKICAHIRGKQSQMQLSSRLGFNHNQLFKWENRERRIPWSDFIKMTELKKIDLKGPMTAISLERDDGFDALRLLNQIVGRSDIGAMSKTLECSKFRIKSWLAGKNEPYLDDMLKIFDRIEHALESFVVELIGEDGATSVGLSLANYKFALFESRNPLFSVLMRVLETKDYLAAFSTDKNYLAHFLSLSVAETDQLIAEALQLGLLEKESSGQLLPGRLVTDIRGKTYGRMQRKYWIDKASERLGKDPMQFGDAFGNLIYSASDNQQTLILERYRSFFNDVRTIIQTEETPEGVFVMNFQMFQFGLRKQK